MAESFGSDIVQFGPGWGNPAIGMPVTTPDPTKDYIYTGPGRMTPAIPQLLVQEIDDVTRNFGVRVYEAMLTDPAVYSSYMALKFAMLSGPVRVVPVLRPKGYRAGQAFVPRDTGKVSPAEMKAVEVAEFCERDIKRPKRPFKSTLLQLCDMMAFGHKLAEKTREEVQAGPDKGKLGLKSIKIKPGWAWKFVVDATMEPVGILTYVPPDVYGVANIGSDRTIASGGLMIVPMDKFVLATWLPRDNDPRGTSALRAAYDWWNLKRQSMPFYYQHLRRFGSPSLDGVLAQGDNTDRPPIDPDTGLEITTAPKVSPIQRFTQALLAFQNNSVIVRPAGSELNVLEPSSSGEAFLHAFDLFDRAICLAIGMQTRASMEAKHGSKADSETATDTRGLVVAHGSEQLGEIAAREILRDSVRLNFGDDVAEEFTPMVQVGDVEQQDLPAMITAVTGAGFQIGQSQWEELDTKLDLPERDMEADEAKAQEMMQQQADMAAQVKGAGGDGPPSKGEGGKAASGKPSSGGQKAKPKPKGEEK